MCADVCLPVWAEDDDVLADEGEGSVMAGDTESVPSDPSSCVAVLPTVAVDAAAAAAAAPAADCRPESRSRFGITAFMLC